MSNKKIHDNHSLISSYPIDYGMYPLAQKINFLKCEINEGDLLFIPKFWYHWIFSDKNSIGVSNFIMEEKFECNLGLDIDYNKPFIIRNYMNSPLSYDEIISRMKEEVIEYAIVSETTDLSPVIKKNINKKSFRNLTIDQCYELANNNNNFVYIGNNPILSRRLPEINQPPEFIESKITFSPRIWISFNDGIQSGLHNDCYHGFMWQLCGKKNILLANPKYAKYCYLTNLETIDNLVIPKNKI